MHLEGGISAWAHSSDVFSDNVTSIVCIIEHWEYLNLCFHTGQQLSWLSSAILCTWPSHKKVYNDEFPTYYKCSVHRTITLLWNTTWEDAISGSTFAVCVVNRVLMAHTEYIAATLHVHHQYKCWVLSSSQLKLGVLHGVSSWQLCMGLLYFTIRRSFTTKATGCYPHLYSQYPYVFH